MLENHKTFQSFSIKNVDTSPLPRFNASAQLPYCQPHLARQPLYFRRFNLCRALRRFGNRRNSFAAPYRGDDFRLNALILLVLLELFRRALVCTLVAGRSRLAKVALPERVFDVPS
jgi:hypothetical protein